MHRLELGRVLGRGARALLSVLAPEVCAACDAPLEAGGVFCERCGVCPAAPGRVALGACVGGAYAPPLSTAIRRLKFGQRTDLAAPLSRLLPAWEGSAEALVVPVPLHLLRLVERGYNAPALLAGCWCRRNGLALAPGLLWRWRETPQQAQRSAAARAENVAGAFVAREGAAGRHAILLDDVVTTGATLAECRAALYAAGVLRVSVVALAATPLARG